MLPHLPPQFKRKVKAALQALVQNPYQAKELKEELEGFPVARSRLILRIKGSVLEIVAFGPRRDIYERAATELSGALRKLEADKKQIKLRVRSSSHLIGNGFS